MPVDLWGGNGFDIACEHACMSKTTVHSLFSLINEWSNLLQIQSSSLVRTIQAITPAEDCQYIGTTQERAFNAILLASKVRLVFTQEHLTFDRVKPLRFRRAHRNLKPAQHCCASKRSRSRQPLRRSSIVVIALQRSCKLRQL
jgi:hypothetical protein